MDLMAFNSITKALYRSLRNLLEMIVLSVFLKHKALIPPKDYAKLTYRLPFYQETNTAMGIILKTFLRQEQRTFNEKKFNDNFPACENALDDLKIGIEFWTQVWKMIGHLNDHKVISSDLYHDFSSANNFLNKKRRELNF